MQRKRSTVTWSSCHPDRPRHGQGLCRSCWDRKRHLDPARRDKQRKFALAYYYKNRDKVRSKQLAYQRDAAYEIKLSRL